MAIPATNKDKAIYHTILADMHRLRAVILNLQTIESGDTEQSLREHFGREQTILTGKLSEWRGHRPQIFREAEADFQDQI
jgi:hypothetical protein